MSEEGKLRRDKSTLEFRSLVRDLADCRSGRHEGTKIPLHLCM